MGYEKIRRPILGSVNNEPVAIRDAIDFSTSEQDTGRKWTDGKTIYQKTVVIAAGPNNSTVTTAHGISGLTEIVDFSGLVKTTAPLWITLPLDPGNGAGGGMGVTIDTTNISLNATIDLSGFSGHATMWYTK